MFTHLVKRFHERTTKFQVRSGIIIGLSTLVNMVSSQLAKQNKPSSSALQNGYSNRTVPFVNGFSVAYKAQSSTQTICFYLESFPHMVMNVCSQFSPDNGNLSFLLTIL